MVDARGRIAWTRRHMPVLASVAEEFSRTRPFDGLGIDVDLIRQMPNGALLANAGHTDREITVSELEDAASATSLEPSLTRYDLGADKSVPASVLPLPGSSGAPSLTLAQRHQVPASSSICDHYLTA